MGCGDVAGDGGVNDVMRIQSSVSPGEENVEVCTGTSATDTWTCETIGTFPNGYDYLYSVDFDADGDLDIFLENNGSASPLFINDGDSWRRVALPFVVRDDAIAMDMNQDGYGDIVNYVFPDLWIRSMRPDGTWFSDEFAGGNGCGYRFEELDHDGDGDLDFYMQGCGQTVVRYTLSGGVFGPPEP